MKRRTIGMFVVALALIAGSLTFTSAARAAPQPGVPGLISDDISGTYQPVTNFKDGSYTATVCPPVGSCDSLSVGSPNFTGVYKKMVGPGSRYHYVPVYVRSWKACRNYTGGTVRECMGGTIVYAANFAACFNGCSVAGLRGSQSCGMDEVTLGASSSLTECRNHLAQIGTSAGYASVAYNTYKICLLGLPIVSCYKSTWHVNAYGSGTITGPYSGYGSA